MKKFNLDTAFIHATDCFFVQDRYVHGGSLYLEIVGRIEGDDEVQPIADVTICLPQQVLFEGQAAVKSYSENTGMFESLLALGFIKKVCYVASSGHVTGIKICQFDLEKLKEYTYEQPEAEDTTDDKQVI